CHSGKDLSLISITSTHPRVSLVSGPLLALHSFPTRRSSDLRSRSPPWKATGSVAATHPCCCSPSPTSTKRRTISRSASPTAQSGDRKSTRLNSSHVKISYAVFCLKKKKAGHANTALSSCDRR